MTRPSSILRRLLPAIAGLSLVCSVGGNRMVCAQTAAPAQAKILSPQQIDSLMPHSVFFRGQTASVQLRNTYGLRTTDGTIVLAGLVDNSGYATAVQQKYQGYILSETRLTINGETLPAGAYGFGFIAGNVFVVMDLGAHDVLHAASKTDASLPHPRPLEIIPGTHAGSYRLYEGRRFVAIRMK
ncbi:MAG: hypothetical protein ACYCOR_07665 [Acidobacteriaceae bacterium]